MKRKCESKFNCDWLAIVKPPALLLLFFLYLRLFVLSLPYLVPPLLLYLQPHLNPSVSHHLSCHTITPSLPVCHGCCLPSVQRQRSHDAAAAAELWSFKSLNTTVFVRVCVCACAQHGADRTCRATVWRCFFSRCDVNSLLSSWVTD